MEYGIASRFIEAIAWTIVHSLWQGLVVALLVWAMIALIPKRNTAWRHGVYMGGLLLFATTAIATLIYKLELSGKTFYQGTPLHDDGVSALTGIPERTGQWAGLPLGIDDLVSDHIGLIFFIWLAGVLFFALRLGFQLAGIQWLRSTTLGPLPQKWMDSWERIRKEAGYARSVALKISAQIDAPMVIGFFKPMILFPVAAVNQLSIQQAEAILHHELAHLIRKDHWWALFLAMMETLFYYHPVVWHIASRIRMEREHRCDEQVVSRGVPGLLYAEALYRIQSIRHEQHALTLGALGPKGELLERIKRILGQTENVNQMRQKLSSFLLITALLAGWAISSGFSPNDTPDDVVEMITMETDSVPPISGKVTFIGKDGKRTEMKVEKGKVVSATENGKVVATAKLPELSARLEKVPPPPPPAPVFEFRTGGALAPGMPGFPPVPPAPGAPHEPMVWMFDGNGIHGDEQQVDVREQDGKTVIRIVDAEGREKEIIIEGAPGAPGHDLKFFPDKEFHFMPRHEMKFMPKGEIKIWKHKGEDGEGINFMADSLEIQIIKGIEGDLKDEQFIIRGLDISDVQLKDMHEALKLAQEEMKEAHIIIRKEKEHLRDEEKRIRMEIRKELDKTEDIVFFNAPHKKEMQVYRNAPGIHRDKVFEETLLKDGLIESTSHYRLKMNENRMNVNGKRITGEAYERYKRLYEKQTRQQLPEEFDISIKKNKD